MSSDEPVRGQGSGNHAPDWRILERVSEGAVRSLAFPDEEIDVEE